MSKFSFSSTTDEVLEGTDLAGKTIVVTGASGGLGEETARALAAHGASVTIAARSQDKLDAAVARIKESTGKTVETGEIELDKPESVRTFAGKWLSGHDRLDILVNNAGVMACPLTRTNEGWELQFATNHLGHFLLTNLLVPALKKGAPSRVVHLSSGGHFGGTGDRSDVNYEHTEYQPFGAYCQSKLANVWFSNELDRRHSNVGIRSFAVAPGAILTDLAKHLPKENLDAMIAQIEASEERMKSIPQGAATTCYAATSPDLDGKGGVYLTNCQIASEGESMSKNHSANAFDPAGEKKLWTLSNELLGAKF